MHTPTTTRPRRGAAPFAAQDTAPGESLTNRGAIIRHGYTLTRSKYGVQVNGPALPSPIIQETLDSARFMADQFAAERADKAAKAAQEWEASCRRQSALKGGFMKSRG